LLTNFLKWLNGQYRFQNSYDHIQNDDYNKMKKSFILLIVLLINFYALIPAAGSGSRMGAPIPKQYLEVLGQPLIYYAIARLCACKEIERVYVVLAPDDERWGNYNWEIFAPTLMPIFCGGSERFESVRNGLKAIQDEVAEDDWVLVHDAARPCLSEETLARLIQEGGTDAVGGLLAVPVADTLKRADTENRVAHTESRAGLWQAQTPQMFRHGPLLTALSQAGGYVPTDEAQAMEQMGLNPKLILGDSNNFKITYAQDLALATLLLKENE